ncbi:hypothetical protein ZWY2020_045120 [Hordeum vulgare]|nr:hypothetical protein ZWY2020_045120 [Hordeum vulgare]
MEDTLSGACFTEGDTLVGDGDGCRQEDEKPPPPHTGGWRTPLGAACVRATPCRATEDEKAIIPIIVVMKAMGIETDQEVRFLTKIYHPNIDKNMPRHPEGQVESSSSDTHSFEALLSAPNPDDPLSENVAKHWKSNEAEAVETSKEWTRMYASGA